MLMRHAGHVLDLGSLPDHAATPIDALLDDDETRAGVVPAARIADRGRHVRAGEDAALAFDRPRLSAGQRRGSACLRGEDVRDIGADDLVARTAMHQHRDLIAHGAGR
jgi:hypothetical protein